jgi:hypothetical protein
VPKKFWPPGDYWHLEVSTLKVNVKKLSELKVRKQCQIKVSNRFAALENISVSEDINGA